VASAMRAIESHRCAAAAGPGGPASPAAAGGALKDGCRAATPVVLTVRRDGRTLTLPIYPRYSAKEKRMLVGIEFSVAPRQLGVVGAVGVAGHEMWSTTTNLLANVGKAFTSEKVRHQFHSIVGITEIAQEAVAAGAGYALVILGFVSLALAVINLFPFLPLDGGHVLWALAEKVRGQRVSAAAMWRFSSVGIILLLFLVINGFSNDISHLAG
ncbi:MAG TPA: M50 family metallopeptidase, partial [Solirubrobacteraceae bacterium]|nr:M50 family metallopeptidase [Solirubrobacteraceae bacterium]